MGEDRFILSYDGEALKEGLMDVRELAPALLSAGELIQSANRLLNGDRTHVSLKVKSDFTRGSFNIDLLVVQDLIEHAKQFLAIHPQVKDAKELLEILFFWGGLPIGTGVGLFKFIRWLRGRNIGSSEITFINNGVIQIKIGDEITHVSEPVLKLAQEEAVRKHAEGIVQPLKREGIEDLRFDAGHDRKEHVTKADVPYFDSGFRDGETLLENSREAVLEIVRLSFKAEHKWGFSDGTTRLRAFVRDERFWADIRSGMRFAKGDKLLVRLRTRTFRNDADELKSEYEVDEVIRHIPRRNSIQPKLDLGTRI